MISCAVVASWMSALASASNWCARNQPWVSASSLAFWYMPKPLSSRGVSTTLAPRKRMSLRRSMEKLSAMVTTSGYPLAAQTMASPIPVLPRVASTTVWPGCREPSRSAASMMPSARRSLTEAAGLKNSALTYMLTCCGARWLRRMQGVSPTVSTMLS